MVLIRQEDIIDHVVKNWAKLHAACFEQSENCRPYFDKEDKRYTLLCEACWCYLCSICFGLYLDCGHWIEDFYWDEVSCPTAMRLAIAECTDTVKELGYFEVVDQETTSRIIDAWAQEVLSPIGMKMDDAYLKDLFDGGFRNKFWISDIADAVFDRSDLTVYRVYYPEMPGTLIPDVGFPGFFSEDAPRAYKELADFFDVGARELLRIVTELT